MKINQKLVLAKETVELLDSKALVNILGGASDTLEDCTARSFCDECWMTEDDCIDSINNCVEPGETEDCEEDTDPR